MLISSGQHSWTYLLLAFYVHFFKAKTIIIEIWEPLKTFPEKSNLWISKCSTGTAQWTSLLCTSYKETIYSISNAPCSYAHQQKKHSGPWRQRRQWGGSTLLWRLCRSLQHKAYQKTQVSNFLVRSFLVNVTSSVRHILSSGWASWFHLNQWENWARTRIQSAAAAVCSVTGSSLLSVVSPILAAVRKTWRKIWKVSRKDYI